MSGYRDWSLDGWRTHLPGVTDVPGYVARLGGESLPALAAAAGSAVPDQVAVTVDGKPITHAGLDQASARVAAWLARRVRPGDRVLLAAGSSIGFVRCYLGALRAGAVVVLADPGYTAAELGHLVADSGAVLAFADREPARRLAGRPACRRRRATRRGAGSTSAPAAPPVWGFTAWMPRLCRKNCMNVATMSYGRAGGGASAASAVTEMLRQRRSTRSCG